MRAGTGGDCFFATLGNVADELVGVTRGGGGGGIGPAIVFPVVNSGGGGGGGGDGEREKSSASKSPTRRSSFESYRLGIFFC